MSLINRINTDLKLKLFSFFLFIGIPILIIGIVFTYYNVSENLKASIGRRFQEIAQQTADKTSFFVEREFQRLQNLSSNSKLIDDINTINENKEKGASPDLLIILNQFHTNNKDEYKRIIMTDKNGRIIASTDKNDNKGYKDKEWWWMTAYNGIAHIGDFYTIDGSYTSTGSIEYLVDIAVPVVDWRRVEVIGVIMATLSGEWLNKAIINTWIGQSGHTMLITQKGIVAVCPLEFKEGDKDAHNIDASIMKDVISKQRGWEIGNNTHGADDAIIGFAIIRLSPDLYRLKKQEWYIFVSQDPAETYTPLYTALWTQFIFGFILIGIFSISGYYIAHKIVKPIKRLKEGTELFASSSLDVCLPVSTDDEIGQLTMSFNNMAGSIKEREDEIKKKNKEWDNTFNSITDLIAIYDSDYRIVRANRAFAQRFNTTAEKLIGMDCSEIFPKQDMSWGICSYVKAMETKDVFQEEVYDSNTGGSLMVTVSPLLDENSEFIGAVLVAKDITEYKNLQAQLLHTEKLAAVGELASGVAHELNNPLCGLMGFTELLYQREIDEKKKDIFAKMFKEEQRAQKIIQNLLSFVRANKQEMMPVEVNKIILDTLDLKEHEFKVNNIDVVKRLSDSLPKINGNFMQLQQVVLNMLTNAQMALLEANKDKKEIVIETRLKGDDNMVEILIKDNGNGIEPQHLSKIFNPFFTTKEAGKGTGLGLSISYGIIKEHNGRIYAESKVGEGAAFYIELPVGTV